jgi:hypothetical protein
MRVMFVRDDNDKKGNDTYQFIKMLTYNQVGSRDVVDGLNWSQIQALEAPILDPVVWSPWRSRPWH